MSKGLRHYPDIKVAVDRRLRQGGGGIGTLAARDYQEKTELKRILQKDKEGKKLSSGEIRTAVIAHQSGVDLRKVAEE